MRRCQKVEETRQIGYETCNLRKDTVACSLGFLFAPHIPDWELNNPQCGNVNSAYYKSTREVHPL